MELVKKILSKEYNTEICNNGSFKEFNMLTIAEINQILMTNNIIDITINIDVE